MRLFIDASVFFAASYSGTGAARELFRLAQQGRVELVVSEVVLEEVRRNLLVKAPLLAPVFGELLQAIPHTVIDASVEQVQEAATYTALEDAPIVAAAKAAGVDCLVSFDRQHLVESTEVAEQSGLLILVPADVLALLRRRTG